MKGSLHVMLRTYSNTSDYNADCDYAVARLDRSYLEQMKDRMKLARKLLKSDESFVCVEFLDSLPQYLCWYESLERLVDFDSLLEGSPVLVDDATLQKIPIERYQHTEGGRMVVLADHVYWECRPRHCDSVTIETAEISFDYLRKLKVKLG